MKTFNLNHLRITWGKRWIGETVNAVSGQSIEETIKKKPRNQAGRRWTGEMRCRRGGLNRERSAKYFLLPSQLDRKRQCKKKRAYRKSTKVIRPTSWSIYTRRSGRAAWRASPERRLSPCEIFWESTSCPARAGPNQRTHLFKAHRERTKRRIGAFYRNHLFISVSPIPPVSASTVPILVLVESVLHP